MFAGLMLALALASLDQNIVGILSIADLAVFAQLRCIDGAEEGRERIAARPAVVEWMARVDGATAAPAAGKDGQAPLAAPAAGRG